MKIKFCLLGWLLPASLICIYAIIEETKESSDFCVTSISWKLPVIFCIQIPVYLLLVLNLMMMIRVLLHFGYLLKGELKTKRRLVRATLILSFLLGMNFAIPVIVLPSIPEHEVCASKVLTTMNNFISSLQGIFVALFYVLRNPEVLQYLKTEMHIELPSTPRASRASRTSRESSDVRPTRGSRSSRTSGNHPVHHTRSGSSSNDYHELESNSSIINYNYSHPGDKHNNNTNGKPLVNNSNHGNSTIEEIEMYSPQTPI